MDKKMVFGTLLFVLGLFLVAVFFANALAHPWNYNGIDGIYGSLLGTETLVPFVFSCLIGASGLGICCYEAYFRK